MLEPKTAAAATNATTGVFLNKNNFKHHLSHIHIHTHTHAITFMQTQQLTLTQGQIHTYNHFCTFFRFKYKYLYNLYIIFEIKKTKRKMQRSHYAQ